MTKENSTPQRPWQEIAEEASKETNPQKLAILIEELNKLLSIKISVGDEEKKSKIA